MKLNSSAGLQNLVLSRSIGSCIFIFVFLWLAEIQRIDKSIVTFLTILNSVTREKTLFI